MVMNKTLKWILGLLATVVLTFAFFAMLKLLTAKNDSSAAKEISAAPAGNSLLALSTEGTVSR